MSMSCKMCKFYQYLFHRNSCRIKAKYASPLASLISTFTPCFSEWRNWFRSTFSYLAKNEPWNYIRGKMPQSNPFVYSISSHDFVGWPRLCESGNKIDRHFLWAVCNLFPQNPHARGRETLIRSEIREHQASSVKTRMWHEFHKWLSNPIHTFPFDRWVLALMMMLW